MEEALLLVEPVVPAEPVDVVEVGVDDGGTVEEAGEALGVVCMDQSKFGWTAWKNCWNSSLVISEMLVRSISIMSGSIQECRMRWRKATILGLVRNDGVKSTP